MRRAAKRDTSEALIVDALRKTGWTVQPLSAPDCPDLLLSKAGRTVVAEVKSGNKKLRPGQAAWFARWQGAVAVLRTVDDVVALNEISGN